jgi:hypothetical protein
MDKSKVNIQEEGQLTNPNFDFCAAFHPNVNLLSLPRCPQLREQIILEERSVLFLSCQKHPLQGQQGRTRISQSSEVSGVTDTDRAFVGLCIMEISTYHQLVVAVWSGRSNDSL